MGSISNAYISNAYAHTFSNGILNHSTHRYTSRLHYAAHDGDCQRITKLLQEGYDLELRDEYGRTPLLRAALKGHVEAFDLLLRSGADFQVQDDWGRCSEHFAAKENHLELLEFIMQLAGFDILNTQDNYGRTPGHLAALNGRLDILHSILSTEYNINSKDKWNRTALHLARKNGHTETAEFLEKYGADKESVDIFGKTPKEME